MTRLHIKRGIACLLLATFAQAQSPDTSRSLAPDKLVQAKSSKFLRELDSSLEAVVAKVSPAVVQIVVTGYGPLEDHGHTNTAVIVREHAIGSGIIVDPDGYIMTNAHRFPAGTPARSRHADLRRQTDRHTQSIGFGAPEGGGVELAHAYSG